MVDCSVVESAVVAGAAAVVVEEVSSSGAADDDEVEEEESPESAATAEPTPTAGSPELELEPDEEGEAEGPAADEDSEDESSESESELSLSRKAGWSDRRKMELISSGVTEGVVVVDEAGDAEAEEAELEGMLETVQACSFLPPPVLVSFHTYTGYDTGRAYRSPRDTPGRGHRTARQQSSGRRRAAAGSRRIQHRCWWPRRAGRARRRESGKRTGKGTWRWGGPGHRSRGSCSSRQQQPARAQRRRKECSSW